ncbi:hypothetical protein AOLI_G00250020 [Acnodon oligacanthus]
MDLTSTDWGLRRANLGPVSPSQLLSLAITRQTTKQIVLCMVQKGHTTLFPNMATTQVSSLSSSIISQLESLALRHDSGSTQLPGTLSVKVRVMPLLFRPGLGLHVPNHNRQGSPTG